MADTQWTDDLGTPGDLLAVQATGGAGGTTDVAALTYAGELWWRRSGPQGWVWEVAGLPPGVGTAAAITAAPLGPAADGAPIGVVGGPDLSVWIHRGGSADPEWTELTGPSNNGAILRPLRLAHDGTESRSVLLASDGVPWLVTVEDATGAFAPVLAPAPDVPDNWSMTGPAAYVAGSVTAGGAPQPHVVLSVNVHEIWESGMRVGFPDGAVWSWVDPGPIPDTASTDLIDAAGVRSADGSVEVWVVFGGREQDGPSWVLHGAGRSWSWQEIGRPADTVYWPRCIADVGGQAWVAAQTVDDSWFGWTAAGGWTLLADVPADGYAWPGGAATAGGTAPWLVGLSKQRLWTWTAAEPRAIDHGTPVTVASVVGTVPTDGITDHHFTLDSAGRLWERGTFPMWIPHGTPGPLLRAPVGTLSGSAFAVGRDEHLWEWRADPGLPWVDHGTPVAGGIRAAMAPVELVADDGTTTVEVLVVGADGHLWARVVDAAPRWEDRGFPPGQLIFGVVGADQAPRPGGGTMSVAAIIGADGHTWIRAADSAWADIGVPRPGDRAAAGIGASTVSVGGGWGVAMAVLGSPSGRVAITSWSPGSPPGAWRDVGAPPGVGVRGTLGLAPAPAGDGVRAVVVGSDGAVWAGTAAGWTSWGRPPGSPVVQGRLTAAAAAVVNTGDGHLWSHPDPG